MRLLVELIDVVAERQRRDVGLQPVDDRARLLARAAVALPDLDLLAGLRQPLRGERRVDRLVELARRIVGDVQQCYRPRALAALAGSGQRGAAGAAATEGGGRARRAGASASRGRCPGSASTRGCSGTASRYRWRGPAASAATGAGEQHRRSAPPAEQRRKSSAQQSAPVPRASHPVPAPPAPARRRRPDAPPSC